MAFMGARLYNPRELLDYLVPDEKNQELLRNGVLGFCIACWTFAIGWLIYQTSLKKAAKKAKKKK